MDCLHVSFDAADSRCCIAVEGVVAVLSGVADTRRDGRRSHPWRCTSMLVVLMARAGPVPVQAVEPFVYVSAVTFVVDVVAW